MELIQLKIYRPDFLAKFLEEGIDNDNFDKKGCDENCNSCPHHFININNKQFCTYQKETKQTTLFEEKEK